LGALYLCLSLLQLRLRLIASRTRINANPNQLEDTCCLLADIGALRDLLHKLGLRCIHRGRRGANRLPGRGQLGLGTLNSDVKGRRIDAVEQIACTDDLVVTYPDLDDPASDLRSGAYDE